MEILGVSREFWCGRRVFLTGHTGFKGGWLALWLHQLGAVVHGYALDPPTAPSMFEVCRIGELLGGHTVADVRDLQTLGSAMKAAQPELVIHMAAQPLVRRSYRDPLETFSTNVMGTAHVLQAARAVPSVRAVLNVTTDKCYENSDSGRAFIESDPLGGHDPYSASKACSELVTSAYRDSFLDAGGVAVASARAGNVIGGGDWAGDRLVPDFLRAADAGQPLIVRAPDSTRPWQHVLEPLSGYLSLARGLLESGRRFASAWNFGPRHGDVKPVRWLADELCRLMPGSRWHHDHSSGQPREARLLELDWTKSRSELQWLPRWTLPVALRHTAEWHLAWRARADMRMVSIGQIGEYGRDVSGEGRR